MLFRINYIRMNHSHSATSNGKLPRLASGVQSLTERTHMDPKRQTNLNRPIKWRENEVMSLLQLYKQYECLWNNKTPEYRNKYVRDKAYTHMIQSLNLDVTVADLRKKIKGLRTTYNDELNKIAYSIKNGAEGDGVYRPSVFWFELADSFLREIAENKRGEVIWNKAPVEKEESPSIDTSYSNTSILNDQEDDEEDAGDHPNDSFYFETPEHRPRKRAITPNPPKKTIDKNKKEDEIDLFGRFVVLQLRKLPEMAGLEVMQEFHRLLIDARKAHFDDNNIDGAPFCSSSSTASKKGKKYKVECNPDPLDESDD